MRCESLPVEGHGKVIWKRSRHHSRDKASLQCNSETRWRRIAATLLGVSFGSYRRRCRDVQMRRCGYVPLRRLGDVPLWHCWVFHLRLIWSAVETYWWDVVIMSPWDIVTTYQWDVVETYHWAVLATFHWDVIGCFNWNVPAMSLGRARRRRYDVARMSCCRLGQLW